MKKEEEEEDEEEEEGDEEEVDELGGAQGKEEVEEDAETETDADAHVAVGAARNCVDVNEVGLPLGRKGRGSRANAR